MATILDKTLRLTTDDGTYADLTLRFDLAGETYEGDLVLLQDGDKIIVQKANALAFAEAILAFVKPDEPSDG